MKYLLFLGLCVTLTLKATVVNVTVLKKRELSGSSKYVWCISHRHLRPWSLPKHLTMEKAKKIVHDQALVLKSFFKRIQASGPATIVLATDNVDQKKVLDQDLVLTLVCKCILEGFTADDCTAEQKTHLEKQVADQMALGSIVFLAQFLDLENIQMIEPRKNLDNILQILIMLIQAYEAKYPNALALATKCRALSKASLKLSPNNFAQNLIKDLNDMIKTANDVETYVVHPENKQAISKTHDTFVVYKNAWDDFLKKFGILGKKSILDNFIYYGHRYIDDAQKLIEALDSYKFLPSLDHELLKIILSPDAAENVILNIGGLHTMNLVEMLKLEGYEVAFDSGFFCDEQKHSFIMLHYQDCLNSDSIKELRPETLEEILNEAFKGQKPQQKEEL